MDTLLNSITFEKHCIYSQNFGAVLKHQTDSSKSRSLNKKHSMAELNLNQPFKLIFLNYSVFSSLCLDFSAKICFLLSFTQLNFDLLKRATPE